MVDRTVGQLRADAAHVLQSVDLTGTFLASSDFESRFRLGDFTLVTGIDVTTKVDRSPGTLLCWVRHRAWSLVASEDVDFPDDLSEASEELVEEHLAWRAQSEWIAQYTAADGVDLSAFELPTLSAFAMVMAPPTIHPYAREHFQSQVSKSPYPAFTMPHLTPLTQFPDEEIIDVGDA